MRKTFYTGDIETINYIPILSPENVIGSYLQTLSNFPNGTGAHLIRKWFSEVMNNLKEQYDEECKEYKEMAKKYPTLKTRVERQRQTIKYYQGLLSWCTDIESKKKLKIL